MFFFCFVLVWSARGWAGSQVPLPDSRRVGKRRHQALDWNNLPVCKCLQRSSTWGTAPAALCFHFHLSPLLQTRLLAWELFIACLFSPCASTFWSWCMVMLQYLKFVIVCPVTLFPFREYHWFSSYSKPCSSKRNKQNSQKLLESFWKSCVRIDTSSGGNLYLQCLFLKIILKLF